MATKFVRVYHPELDQEVKIAEKTLAHYEAKGFRRVNAPAPVDVDLDAEQNVPVGDDTTPSEED